MNRYANAIELFETFNGRPVSEAIPYRLAWPDQLESLGIAKRLLYLSDKEAGGGDGSWIQFEHPHDTKCFFLAPAGSDPAATPFRSFVPPKRGELAILGWCLQVDFDRGAGVERMDFAAMPSYPWLAGDPHRGLLCILDSWSPVPGPPLLIYGPHLTIEDRGIVG